ncbi:hypothetical protein M8818_000778 [Zalaria obscura]|uniref:Uncharacterized protein n=1 Tax=Zalaria obscura TaxID=2024903 RepID=A0ACC3SMA2_9PEZI
MSRRYPTADVYEERERDFYARPRGERNYEELDIDLQRARYTDRAPAETVVSDRRQARVPGFLRDDYGRTNAGPLVVRERAERDEYSDTRSRRGPPPERVERDELVIRERERVAEPRRRERDVREEDTVSRRGDREPERPRRRGREVEETDISIRREEDERPRSRAPPRDQDREYEFRQHQEIAFRRGQGDRGPPPPGPRAMEEEEVLIRRRHDSPSPPPRSPPPRSMRGEEVERERFEYRERERAPPRPRSLGPPVAKEREEFIFRRRREPSPPPPPDYEKEEIIIRRRERTAPREPSPESVREPSPEPLPPPPEPIYRPPIIQEVITHHRHIDHGVERARSPTPPPAPSPSPPPPHPARDESLEIEIRRRGMRNGQPFYDELDFYERDREDGRVERDFEVTQRRSASAKPDNRRASGRQTKKDMWTEVTKDLVIKEAIEELGYEYDETEYYFYVMEYLKYDDVLQLVEVTEDIRRERRERLKEIQWEREEKERQKALPPPPPRSKYDERIYEREVVYDSTRPAGRYR